MLTLRHSWVGMVLAICLISWPIRNLWLRHETVPHICSVFMLLLMINGYDIMMQRKNILISYRSRYLHLCEFDLETSDISSELINHQ